MFETTFYNKIFLRLSQTNNWSKITTQFESNLSAKLTLLWRKHTQIEPILSWKKKPGALAHVLWRPKAHVLKAHRVCALIYCQCQSTCAFFRDRIGSISMCYLQRSASFANGIDSTRVIIRLELLVCDNLRMICLIQCCINTKLIFQNKYLSGLY